MNNDYLWDRSGPKDPDTDRLEQLLSEFRSRPQPLFARRRSVAWIVVPAAAAALLLLAFALHQSSTRVSEDGWTVAAVVGTPTLDGSAISDDQLVVNGQWVETDMSSRLRIGLGAHGEVFLEPGSRLRVVSTAANSPHLDLADGMVHVSLWSKTDVTIETPSATAIEREGDFLLAVDTNDRVCLSVNSGRVTLREGAHASFVPAGAVCEAYPGSGPGTPFCESAPDRFRLALEAYDLSDHSIGALESVLSEAGTCDLVPLWHLLQRVDNDLRARIYDFMAQLQPPPAGVSREGVVALDRSMLEHWWESIRHYHSCLICAESSANMEPGPVTTSL